MHLYPSKSGANHGLTYILATILSLLTVAHSVGFYSPQAITLPPTPSLPTPRKTGYVNLTTVSIWYAHFGPPLASTLHSGSPPILFLHGGFANSDYFGLQIRALLAANERSTIIAIDSRLQGRSTGVLTQPISYELMREDVIAVLDYWGVKKVTVVGWSDGGIIGLELAMHAPERLQRLFAFGASYAVDNVNASAASAAQTSSLYNSRVEAEFKKLNPSPGGLEVQKKKINTMFETLPNYTQADLARIPTLYQDCLKNPLVWIVDGADEEVIKLDVPRTLHSWIPGSGLVVLPGVSHFAFLQDAQTFNAMIRRFLDFEVNCSLDSPVKGP